MPYITAHAYIPHPHSFPTRRSSDLSSIGCSPTRSMMCWPPPQFRRAKAPRGIRMWFLRPFGRAAGVPGRSEEHTSELQSRGHLVCRLLLEKKNKNYNRMHSQTVIYV